MNERERDEHYMAHALELALKAKGMTAPNPVVGSLVVRDGRILGSGYHRRAGMPHAEVEALRDAERRGEDVTGATLYVTLEPCCHEGKRTPPCAPLVASSGVRRVVVGCLDRNPSVAGKGVEYLRRAGLEVVVGVLESRCVRANEEFFKHVTTGLPFVTLKLAASLDGRIAARSGDSKWIGSPRQRERAHRLRLAADAVLVGVATVLADDPRLDARVPGAARQPRPVVMDSTLCTPPEARLVSLGNGPIVATVRGADPARKRELVARGVEVPELEPDSEGRVGWHGLLEALGERGITALLVEGGGRVAASALTAGVVDKIVLFFSPLLVGGDGVPMTAPLGVERMEEALRLEGVSWEVFGDEVMVEGYPRARG